MLLLIDISFLNSEKLCFTFDILFDFFISIYDLAINLFLANIQSQLTYKNIMRLMFAHYLML